MELRQRPSSSHPSPSHDQKKDSSPSIPSSLNGDSSSIFLRKFLYVLAVALIFIWVLQSNFVLVDGHGGHGHSHDAHDHDHDHHHDHDDHAHAESVAYRYSKAANEEAVSVQIKIHFLIAYLSL